MPLRPLDTLLGFKALSVVSGLTENDRRVAATLLEHFNRKTGRCDPSLGRIAGLLGINTRTVIRSVGRLESAGLLRKHRHGGHFNCNSYEPLWPKLRELEAAWDERFKGGSSTRPQVSHGHGQPCHLGSDAVVTQTYPNNNLPKGTCSGGQPRKEDRPPPVGRRDRLISLTTTGSADAMRASAERRWNTALLERYVPLPVTFADIVSKMDTSLQEAATDAEMRQRGAGLTFIENALGVWNGRPAVQIKKSYGDDRLRVIDES